MNVTLPGDIDSFVAGPLLRQSAPVFALDDSEQPIPIVGVVGPRPFRAPLPELCRVVWPDGCSLCDPTELALDLCDTVGMDIAVRWLARHHGLELGATAPGWYYDDDESWRLHANGIWFIFSSPGLLTTLGGEKRILVPGISAVSNPAEALALACLAAGGR